MTELAKENVEKTKEQINREKKQAFDAQKVAQKRFEDMKKFYRGENELLRLIVENMELTIKHDELKKNPVIAELNAKGQVEGQEVDKK